MPKCTATSLCTKTEYEHLNSNFKIFHMHNNVTVDDILHHDKVFCFSDWEVTVLLLYARDIDL